MSGARQGTPGRAGADEDEKADIGVAGEGPGHAPAPVDYGKPLRSQSGQPVAAEVRRVVPTLDAGDRTGRVRDKGSAALQENCGMVAFFDVRSPLRDQVGNVRRPM